MAEAFGTRLHEVEPSAAALAPAWRLVDALAPESWRALLRGAGGAATLRAPAPGALRGAGFAVCCARQIFQHDAAFLPPLEVGAEWRGIAPPDAWLGGEPPALPPGVRVFLVFDVYGETTAGHLARAAISVAAAGGDGAGSSAGARGERLVFPACAGPRRTRTHGAASGACEEIAVEVTHIAPPFVAQVQIRRESAPPEQPHLPQRASVPGAILLCVAGVRVVATSSLPPASEWTLTIAPPERRIEVAPPRAPGARAFPACVASVDVECTDGVERALVRARYREDERAFEAWIPPALGAGAPPAPGRAPISPAAHRVVAVRAMLNGAEPIAGAARGQAALAAVERSQVFALFSPRDANDRDLIARGLAVRHMSHDAVWRFGRPTAKSWEELVGQPHGRRPFADVAPFNIVGAAREAPGDGGPEVAAVFVDALSEFSTQTPIEGETASIAWREASGQHLVLPAASELEPGHAVAVAANIYGRSNAPGSAVDLVLTNPFDASDVHVFPLLRGGEDRTHRNPHVVAHGVTHLLAADARAPYDVEVRVRKAAPTGGPSILFCFSGLRAVDSAPFCPKRSAAVAGELFRPVAGGGVARSEAHLCAVLRRPDGSPARASGAERVYARLVSADGLGVARCRMEFDALSAHSRREAIFSVPYTELVAAVRSRIESEYFLMEVLAEPAAGAGEERILSERPMAIAGNRGAAARSADAKATTDAHPRGLRAAAPRRQTAFASAVRRISAALTGDRGAHAQSARAGEGDNIWHRPPRALTWRLFVAAAASIALLCAAMWLLSVAARRASARALAAARIRAA